MISLESVEPQALSQQSQPSQWSKSKQSKQRKKKTPRASRESLLSKKSLWNPSLLRQSDAAGRKQNQTTAAPKAATPKTATRKAVPKTAVRMKKPPVVYESSSEDDLPINKDDMDTMLLSYLLQRKHAQQDHRRTMWAQMARLS